jgi:hypothetical protein
MKLAHLKVAGARIPIAETLLEFASPDIWRREGMDYLDEAINFLEDHALLAKDVRTGIGIYLLDEGEAKAVQQFADCLNVICEGKPRTVETFLKHPVWPQVMDTARRAYEAIVLNGLPGNADCP